MRITGGSARGIPLTAPRGDRTRPATDQAREAVFSWLGDGVTGARCLDLFAGTGAYGLEALSRGAASCIFLENHRGTAACLRRNLEAVEKSIDASAGSSDATHAHPLAGDPRRRRARILEQDVFRMMGFGQPFDLVFADPPYPLWERGAGNLFFVLEPLITTGRVILEVPGGFDPEPPGWRLLHVLGGKKARRGGPSIRVYTRASDRPVSV
ncbi:MAG: RsmD family RNA methyltransferase [Opitutales bacterium]